MLKKMSKSRQGTIESLKLKIDGHQTHYLRAGSGPPVVLLHGGASDSHDWIRTMAGLSHRYSLYAPDMVGYGLSKRNKNSYYLADFVEFTLEFIQTMSLDLPVLVGHSLGGRVSLEIAFRYPERVDKLVLVDTMGFGRLTPWGSFVGTAAWLVCKLRRLPQPYPEFLIEDGQDTYWTCLEQLPELRVPTLIVWKRYDPYFSLALARESRALIPEARLAVLPGYGHAPHLHNTDAFNNLLRNFLDGC